LLAFLVHACSDGPVKQKKPELAWAYPEKKNDDNVPNEHSKQGYRETGRPKNTWKRRLRERYLDSRLQMYTCWKKTEAAAHERDE